MSKVNLFAIGNALIDQEFSVPDSFLAKHNLHKASMQLTEKTNHQKLLKELSLLQPKYNQSSGGSAANTVFAFTALGGTAYYGCRVGNDNLGKSYLYDLNKIGVITSTHSVSYGDTGSCIVLITPDSERTMQTYLGVTSKLSENEINFDMLPNADWLYIEGYLLTSPDARLAINKACYIAKANGVKIALSFSDPSVVKSSYLALEEIINIGINIIFCNQMEALIFSQTEDIKVAIERLLKKVEIVIITLGKDGAIISNNYEKILINGENVKAIDTNGAGDAFAGSFLYALHNGYSLKDAGEFANVTSSYLVQQFGARLSREKYKKLFIDFESNHKIKNN
ncbi:adenosine kinase [Acinetobacter seifertii]|uniref:Adenosine kinase n=1 Tax=Acinetobacter seifertii TaxID=1530123 RepID=A0A7H2PXI2_9GAMM|nr:adenosine kinase [Acinetobacter seifertii]QNY16070.1 adenosine kinase [Acinetobacter seifertii]